MTNSGVPGVDEQSFGDIEAYGSKNWRNKTYRPQPVYIPKPNDAETDTFRAVSRLYPSPKET
jgi:hypothetical protein